MSAIHHTMANVSDRRTKAMNVLGNGYFRSEFDLHDIEKFSISLWFKPNLYPSHGCIFNYGALDIGTVTGGTGVGFGFGGSPADFENNGMYCSVLFNGQAWRTLGGMHYDGWHQYVLTVNLPSNGSGSILRAATIFYIDGVRQASFTNNMKVSANGINILGYHEPIVENRLCNGQATRVCMYPSILTPDFIASDFALGLTTPPDDLSTMSHYWNGDVAGGVVKDHIGDWSLSFNGDANIVSI